MECKAQKMRTVHGKFLYEIEKLLKNVERFWKGLRRFALENRTIFEIFFISLYTLEQAALIWFTYVVEKPEDWSFVVSIFALMVLTTFALHKLTMESRIRVLETQVNDLQHEKSSL